MPKIRIRAPWSWLPLLIVGLSTGSFSLWTGVASGSEAKVPVIVHIAPGESHSVLLTADGAVWTCGNGGDGQLGWKQEQECFSGVRVSGLPKITDIAAGTGFSVFLDEKGELWGAGYGIDERLGPKLTDRVHRPVQLGIGGLIDVAAFTNFTLGRRTDGTVVAFGVNDAGGLGSGSDADSATPVETGVVATAIDAGGGYSLALTKSGKVLSWGMNSYGTLGNPDVPRMGMRTSTTATAKGFFSLSPVPVAIDGVVAISAGRDHALAVKADGTVWGWGRNINGSLAQPNQNALYPSPVQIPGLSDITAVAAGAEYSLALAGDGRVFSWGVNSHGQLGRRFKGRFSPQPTAVPGLSNISKIIAGAHHAFAIDARGRAWAWGFNQYGSLLAEMAEEMQQTPSPVTFSQEQ